MSADARTLLTHLHRLAVQAAPDATLLTRWIHQRDQAAFAALMARHGPMVLGICRRSLGDEQDAEDAFQATFLLLSRQASRLRQPESLAGFLHTVAVRLARKARIAKRGRQRMESNAETPEPMDIRPNPLDALSGRELLALLDTEVARLPEVYRLPFLLCLLQGRTVEEASRLLGWSIGSVRGRLARGRERLRRRLTQRGSDLSVGAVALLTPAIVPEKLLAESLHHISGPVPAAISVLAGGMMPELKLKTLAFILILGTAVGLGAGLPLQNASEPQRPPARSPAAPLLAQAKKKPQPDHFGDPLPAGAVARLGTTRLRHAGWVNGIAYSPDGTLLASGGSDERVRLWDAKTGKEVRQFHLGGKGLGASPVDSVAFSPDGKLLAAAGWGTELALWDVASGKEVLRQQGVTRYVVFSPDKRTIVLGGVPNQGARLLDLPSNERRMLPLASETIHAVAFSPDGKLLATAGSNNEIALWEMPSLKQVCCCRGHQGEVRCLDFAPDGKQLVTASMDKTVRVWDPASGKEIRRIQAPGIVDGIRWSPEGKMIAVRSNGDTILLWDAKSGEMLRQFVGYGGGSSYPMAFSADGKHLLAVQGNALQLWETATGKIVFPASAIREGIRSLAYTGDGLTMATVSWEGTIRLWDTDTQQERRCFGGEQPGIRTLAISHDGRLVATAGHGKTTLWNTATATKLFRWDTDINDGFDLAFTPNGQVLASANGDGSIQLWQTGTGKPLRRLTGHSQGPVYGVAFSPDGQMLLSGGLDKTMRLWDWNTNTEIRAFKDHNDWVMAVAFAPDGTTAASACGSNDPLIRLWNVKTGKELRSFEAHEPAGNTAIVSIAYSPDGRMLASAGFGETVHLWEVATGKERCRFHGQDYRISRLTFSQDGSVLASIGDDSTALFWDATGRQLYSRPRYQLLTRQEWESRWNDLAKPDGQQAYRALQALVADSEQTIAQFKQRIRPVNEADAKQTARLIRELDSDDFAVRTKANEELAKLGESVRLALEQTLQRKPSLEVSRRIVALLDQLEPEHSPGQLRLLRAVEAVEQIRIPTARQLLASWSMGIPTARLTREARDSLQRLDLRKPFGR
ncbi:MAG TPA: sigma-70 family RNA polymerase sigma factor [Gemmataceae bacterium]|nr:sigma-70 family RNA polymerase sigma factor [Gemmataceae bacterium]